jgi:hypothetical protein
MSSSTKTFDIYFKAREPWDTADKRYSIFEAAYLMYERKPASEFYVLTITSEQGRGVTYTQRTGLQQTQISKSDKMRDLVQCLSLVTYYVDMALDPVFLATPHVWVK